MIIQEDGLVEKLAGDAVSAFWGPGIAGPKYVARTIRAAQNILKTMNQEKIPVGIGVNAGVAFFGAMGSANGLVNISAIGDEVNLAARLASKAAAGEIVVSEKALKLAGMDHPTSHTGLEYILAHIIQNFMESMRKTGLSAPQINALLHIYHSQNGECGLSEISGLMDSSGPAASQLVERLVQQGMVERTEDPLNRRNKKLRLTDKCLKLIQNGITSNHFLMDLMTSLPAKQRETVHAAFGYLAQAGQRIQFSQSQKDNKHS